MGDEGNCGGEPQSSPYFRLSEPGVKNPEGGATVVRVPFFGERSTSWDLMGVGLGDRRPRKGGKDIAFTASKGHRNLWGYGIVWQTDRTEINSVFDTKFFHRSNF